VVTGEAWLVQGFEAPEPSAPRPPDPEPAPAPAAPWRRRTLLALLLIAVLVGAVVAYRSSPPPKKGLTQADVDKTVKSAVDKAVAGVESAPPHSTQVYQTILPSLVVITTDSQSEEGKLGAGVIVDQAGAILTANHVVDGASTITVTFVDGTETTAQVTTSQPENDIAVLQPDKLPSVIVPATLAGRPQVGDEAFAVGHPFGMVQSLSAGVISGLDRELEVPDGRTLKGLIQFDAAVNPGNSGGPLLNRQGQVVGIVTALANPSKQGTFIGLGFAVPIATAGGAAGGPPQ
jgi:S1-C subfamily serine protease